MAGAHAVDLPAAERARLTETLRRSPPDGSVLLATCHRVELYGNGVPPPAALPRRLRGEDALRHLFRVAAGLSSAVVGEDQILHQVRRSLAAASQPSPATRRAFEDAIATGRRVRATLPTGGAGLEEPAASWLAARARPGGAPALVVGSGPLGQALASALRGRGFEVLVAGRTRRPGVDLDLAEAAGRAPSARLLAIALRGVWNDLTGLDGTGLPPVADLSVPSALPDGLRTALGGRLLEIDDLAARRTEHETWTAAAEKLVERGAQAHLAWSAGRHAVPVVQALRQRADERREERLRHFLRGQPELAPEDQERVRLLTRRIVGDLLHEPLTALRADADGRQVEAARRLFGL